MPRIASIYTLSSQNLLYGNLLDVSVGSNKRMTHGRSSGSLPEKGHPKGAAWGAVRPPGVAHETLPRRPLVRLQAKKNPTYHFPRSVITAQSPLSSVSFSTLVEKDIADMMPSPGCCSVIYISFEVCSVLLLTKFFIQHSLLQASISRLWLFR